MYRTLYLAVRCSPQCAFFRVYLALLPIRPPVRALASFLFILLLLGLVLVGASALLGGPAPLPAADRVDGLAAPAVVQTADDASAALIEAQGDDFWTALGYAHALADPWTPLAMRQIGLAEVSQWTGAEGASLDRHSATLELGRGARALYDALDATDQARLTAYAAGFDAAVRSAFDAGTLTAAAGDPAPWEPWHSALVAHVAAYATAPLAVDSAAAMDTLRLTFEDERRAFRTAAAAYSFDGSATFSHGDSLGQTGVIRWGAGSSARPPYHLSGAVAGADTTWRVTLIGTPLELARWDDSGGWAALPSPAPVVLTRAAPSDTFVVSEQRIRFADDLEIGFRTGRAPGRRLLDPSRLVVAWSGLDQAQGAFSAEALLGAKRVAFGPRQMPTAAATDTLTLVLSQALDSLGAEPLDLVPLSGLALAQTRALAARVDTSLLPSPLLQDAALILQGWNGQFDEHSVGATLYDAWLGAPRASPPPDTSGFFVSARVTADFSRAVGRLARAQGAATSNWRWGAVHPRSLYLPLARTALPDNRSVLDLPGFGHPTALVYQHRTGADSLSSSATFAVARTPEGIRIAAPRYTPNRMFDRERRRYDVPRFRPVVWGERVTLEAL
jgi:acyl-homoserine lactone acylase PvdQ